VIKREVSGKP